MDSQEHGVERTALAGACVNVVDSHVVVVVNVVNVVFVECTERLDQPSARGRHDTDEQQAGERRIVLSDMRQFAHALTRRPLAISRVYHTSSSSSSGSGSGLPHCYFPSPYPLRKRQSIQQCAR